MTAKDLQGQLTRYFDGDIEKVKKLSKDCKDLDFKLSDNLEAIQQHPEQFQILITFSDLGILDKVFTTLSILKGTDVQKK